MNLSEINFPRNLSELMTLMHKERKLQVIAGATTFGSRHATRFLAFEPSIACIKQIPELSSVHKTERMISIGAACTLSELENVYPFIHTQGKALLHSVGTSAVRNAATLGGHIMYEKRFLSLWPLLACLDTELEFRSSTKINTKNIWYMADDKGYPSMDPQSVLARIRIPLQSIDHLFIKRVGSSVFPEGDAAYLTSVAILDQRSVANFKLVVAGERAFRDIDAEERIISSPLPLSDKIIQNMLRSYAESLRKQKYWNTDVLIPLIAQALEDLQRISRR